MISSTLPPGHGRQTGLSKLEFSVVAAVLSVIAGSLLVASLYYEEMTESTVVQLTVRNMRSGMRYQIADKLIQGRTRELSAMVRANPVAWIDRSPEGYVGPVRHGDIGSLPKGSWFFDEDTRELGYIPKLSFHLSVERERRGILRWQVRALKSDGPSEVQGLMLIPVNPYRWF
ncbi:MAG: hypothetical protein A3G25_14160 [Betaproteobacteria bacterium RIFCSPLOWO2_12_FULL_63_13]|nr:MAG: hypothetical protein A3H32_02205 [Betaproteobacteria bacterium RIFCSPLOWO2_02_FULL_63_19]OGA50762.1 MAG: hypothetical protein A3G25_14160 [Betaproteobacteria bacterium RIFCSPLOWO2_12_FULL_63_13]